MRKIFARILNKFKILHFFNFSIQTVVNKQKVNIPLLGNIGLDNLNITEPWMSELLGKILKFRNNCSYIDVGVNVGQTLIKLRTVDANIQYFGFEPNPICVNYVKELVKVNQYQNVTIFPVGIANEDRIYELSFYSEGNTDSSASMIENFRPLQKTYRKEFIPCFTIEKVAQKFTFPQIGILKIDVEGGEKDVIEGFASLIIRDKPFIQIEILPVYNTENKERLARQEFIENFLNKIDYKIFRIHLTPDYELDSLEEINTIGIHSSMQWCEYLLVPSSEKDLISKSINTKHS